MALPSNPTTVKFIVPAGGTTSNVVQVDGRLVGLGSKTGLPVAANMTFRSTLEGLADTLIVIEDNASTTKTTRTIPTASTGTAAFNYPLALGDWLGVIYLQLVFSAAQTGGTTVYGTLAGSGV